MLPAGRAAGETGGGRRGAVGGSGQDAHDGNVFQSNLAIKGCVMLAPKTN